MKRRESVYHVPVMLEEAVAALDVKEGGTYVDCTFGGGGHSRAIMERMGTEGRLYAFDQDEDAMKGVPEDARLTFILSNFRYIARWMRYYGVERVDGIMADLGMSSHHLDTEGRGFSFQEEGELDMRMNRKGRLTASRVVNEYGEEALSDVLYYYGELRESRRIAHAIVKARGEELLLRVGDLVRVVAPVLEQRRAKKDMARVFQALRIEVNDEMAALRDMLGAVPGLLKEDGRLAVLTYHSLEDRMVKNFIAAGNEAGEVGKDVYGNVLSPLEAVGRAVTPTEEEQAENPRSRSGRLRVARLRRDAR